MLRSVILLLGLIAAASASAQTGVGSIPVLPSHAGGQPIYVSVSIGGGPPSPVSIDTGSTGLYVFKREVGPDIALSDVPIHQSYVDGTNFRGVIGTARVVFTEAGGRVETRPMKIGVITEVFCSESHPDCPGSDRKPGVMGLGLDTGGRLASPLAQIDGPGADGFVVDLRRDVAPRIVVGLSPRVLRDFHFASLKPGRPSTIGLPSWDAGSAMGIYGVDGQQSAAQPVILDTGEFDTVFDPGPIRSMQLGPHGFLLPGQTFTLTIPGALAFAVRTDRSMFIKPKATPRSNSGALLFRSEAVAFDARNGRVGFSP
ncbi:hypothetical protein NFI95_06710 [Acetobacteraceae bacterium KSS8]|uniref:PE cleavage protein A C-terminal domain-containing protein n=1 Tax=Endosaccharibacter trunci TaxID=2812733 RepID=A0ABT1W5V8_9PROT|nr:hypothetical protein [Acetobacteraceae bacterium KSS8]